MPRSTKQRPDTSDNLCGALFSPVSDWTPPRNYPDLSGEKALGIDIESKDPHLIEEGPGFLRGDAKVVGVSIATMDRAWYFPIDHLGGGNLDRENTLRYLRNLLDQDRYWAGANLQYDLEGLDSLGLSPRGRCIDVQLAEALIDEERETYRLDALAQAYLGRGKDESLLREAALAYQVDPKAGLWKLHSKYVGPYAEWDALATMQIFAKQKMELERQELMPIFTLESELLPILWKMRKQGIPIDLDAATKLSAELKIEEDALRDDFKRNFGQALDEWSGPQIAMLCDQHKVIFPRTALGNPSFTADYLDDADHPLMEAVAAIRRVNKFRQTFVNGWLMEWNIKGRIHPNWKQVARDDGGTRSGRMAASNPNPQQVPASKFRKTGKPSKVGALIRGCFISDTGLWCKLDYSQQEPRILTHYAAITGMTGANVAKMAYVNKPKMDFYQFMVEAAGIDRRPAKDMYLGRCYGMGVKKLARKLNRTEDEARAILADFDEKVPFVKEIADKCTRVANDRGYIKTLLGRRRHFNLWEPQEYGRMSIGESPLRKELAIKQWGPNIRRANTHKALNALIQGSAADMNKASIVKIYNETGTVPYLAMHDELDAPVQNPEHADALKKCCETCVETCVPMVVDMDVGRSWK